MTSPGLDEDLNAGESGFWTWHNSVAKHHNDDDATAPHHAGKNISVSPSGLTIVTTSNVQAALAEIDASANTHHTAANPHSSSASTTALSNHTGAGNPHSDSAADPHGGGAHSEDYARGDGTLSVGQLAKIKTVSPLTLEGIDSSTFRKVVNQSYVLTAGMLDPLFGNAAKVNVQKYGFIRMPDAASAERAEGAIHLEASAVGAVPFDVVLQWANETTNTGDVFWKIIAREVDAGGDISDTSANVTQSVFPTAGSQYILAHTTLLAGHTFNSGKVLITVERHPYHSNDTLGGDVLLERVMFNPKA